MDLDTLRHRLGDRGASLPHKVIAFKGEPAFPEPSIKMAYLDARAQHLINPYLQDTRGNGERNGEGLREGGWGFYGVIHSLKAIRTGLDTNL